MKNKFERVNIMMIITKAQSARFTACGLAPTPSKLTPFYGDRRILKLIRPP